MLYLTFCSVLLYLILNVSLCAVISFSEWVMSFSSSSPSRATCDLHDACSSVNPLNANFTRWSNTLKQFVNNFADELFECV